MDFEHIRLSHDDGVATLTLSRPETRNAMTPEMGDEVVRAVAQIGADPAVRVVVLTGEGKAFSSGGDLKMLARDTGLSDDSGPTMGGSPGQFYRRYLAIRDLAVPTIAAINGHAIGAGLCLALACDLRVAADSAKMGMTFTRIGIHPGMGATFLLPRLVGTARACDLLFTGRVFDAAEAERMGLLTRLVPAERLGDEVASLAHQIATSGPIAVRLVKKAIYRGTEHSLEQMLDFESLQQGLTLRTDDAREGIAAVMAKRDPEFKGR